MQETFRVGKWVVAPDTDEISNRSEIRKMDHKVMRLLTYLSHHAGRDLSKEEIIQAVWGEGVHSEEVLTVAVSSLRKALKDDPRKPHYIKTIPRYGYRMLQPRSPISQTSDKQNILQYLENKAGLRFLILSIIITILFYIYIILSKSHFH